MTNDKLVLIYTTFADVEQAENTIGQLVEQKLIACANLFPGMISIYHWQGDVERGAETAALLKTLQNKQDAVLDKLRELHPYEVPAIIVVEPSSVDTAYLSWASSELAR